MNVRIAIWLTIVTVISLLLGRYLYWRTAQGLPSTLRWVVLAYLIAAIVAPWFARLAQFGLHVPAGVVNAIAWFGYINMGLLSTLFWVYLLTDASLGIYRRASAYVTAPAVVESAAGEVSRRDWLLGTGTLLTAAASLTAWGVYRARGIPPVLTTSIAMPRWPKGAAPVRLLQISDIHLGPTIKGDFLAAVVDRVMERKPDIVAITGDLVDGSVETLGVHAAELQRLTAPLGVYFITGNHEYYSGATQWIEFVRNLGITVLENTSVLVQSAAGPLHIAGVSDLSAPSMDDRNVSDPRLALTPHQDEPNIARILLAHQPRSALHAQDLGYDLQISGHTHGGQFFPYNWLVYLAQPYVWGLRKHKGERETMQIYVSRGTGYWGPPIRLGAPAEISELVLGS
jgi:predicted MPP superfamily phosphohydrolase